VNAVVLFAKLITSSLACVGRT